MIVLLGGSASGKSSIAKYITDHSDYEKIVTCTTRPIREGEVDGVDYHFLSEDEFKQKKNNNEFLETAVYNGWFYGSLTKDYTDNKTTILTPSGLRNLKRKGAFKAHFHSYYISVNRRNRIIMGLKRGDDIEEVYRRSLSDIGMFDGIESEVDIVINNENYEKSISEIGDRILEWERNN